MATRKAKVTTPPSVDWRAQANALKAIANPARIQIIALLHTFEGEMTASEIMFELERFAQPTVSHHLAILVRAGIVIKEKRGVFSYHVLDEHRLEETVEGIKEILCHHV